MEDSVSVKELDELCKAVFDKRIEIEKQEEITSKLNAELTTLKQKIVGILETLERENYQSPHGTVYRSERMSVTTPKTWEDKQAFMAYLREKGGEGLVQSYITFNNKSLLSFVKNEVEAREADGDLDVSIPGVGKVSRYIDLGIRKK